MKLLLCNRDGRPSEAWLNDLRRALPEAQVDEWQPGGAADYDAAIVWNPQQGQYKRLVDPGDTKNGWGGPNREVTGTFNPCFGCDFAKACVQELANDYKRR